MYSNRMLARRERLAENNITNHDEMDVSRNEHEDSNVEMPELNEVRFFFFFA